MLINKITNLKLTLHYQVYYILLININLTLNHVI